MRRICERCEDHEVTALVTSQERDGVALIILVCTDCAKAAERIPELSVMPIETLSAA